MRHTANELLYTMLWAICAILLYHATHKIHVPRIADCNRVRNRLVVWQ